MYVTAAQLADRPGPQELAQVATPGNAAVVDYALMEATLRGTDRSGFAPGDVAVADAALARITDAVADADSLIDGFLAKRGYALPLASVPDLIANWSRVIARYYLHQHRISDTGTDPIARDYRDALKLLQLVADGKFSPGISDPAQPTTGAGPVEVSAPERIFTQDTLKDYPA